MTDRTDTIVLAGHDVTVEVPDDERLASFWTDFVAGRFEPATVDVLTDALRPGGVLIDVGAWIGPFALLGAALGAEVHAYEPDPVARAVLERNVAANAALPGSIVVHDVALGARTATVGLDGGAAGLGTGRSTVVGTGVTGSVVHQVDARVEAATDPWRRATVIKLDVEGAEHAVVPRLGRYLRERRPVLLLSLHGADPVALRARGLGRVRMAAARLAGLPARARLLWALRGDASWERAHDHRTPGWVPLTTWQRLSIAIRLGEMELRLRPRAPARTRE